MGKNLPMNKLRLDNKFCRVFFLFISVFFGFLRQFIYLLRNRQG
jgi:hypothetical protein